MRKVVLLALFSAILLGCSSDYKNLEEGLYADMKTDKGNVIMKLYFEEVPVTVANFVSLAEGDVRLEGGWRRRGRVRP